MSVKVHEAFSLDSFQDRLLFFDDFHGDQLQDEWDSSGFAGGSAVVVDAQTGGIVRLTTDTDLNDTWQIDWGANPNEIRSLLVTKKVTMEVRLKLNDSVNSSPFLLLRFDANNSIGFYYIPVSNWMIQCIDGGAPTNSDSGIAPDNAYHILRMECHTHGSNHVHFYIDGIETANSPITTNVPDDAGDYLMPFLLIRTKEADANFMDIDYCYIRQER